MFGLKKRGPTRPFTHADNCKILEADPTIQIQWSEVETGHWRAVCQCGSEDTWGRVRFRQYRRAKPTSPLRLDHHHDQSSPGSTLNAAGHHRLGRFVTPGSPTHHRGPRPLGRSTIRSRTFS